MSDDATLSDAQIRRLVAQLADFSTRFRARTRLVLAGAPAVPALIEALNSPIEGVAWSAAKTLGEIGREDAVQPLTQALSVPALKEVASEAIRRITGRDPSETPQRLAPASAGRAEMSDEQLARALASGGSDVHKSHAGYVFTVNLPGGRRQKVDMTLTLKDADGSRLVALYTECGPASPDRYEWALKTNLKTPFGAFAVRDTAQGPRFVMVDAYLRDSADVHQLARAIETLAKRADALEQSISDTDSA